MTAQDLFDTTLALMGAGSEEAADYENQYMAVLNILTAETFDINNSIRVKDGKEELTEAPVIDDLTDTLEYEDQLLRLAFPYGIAGHLIMEDDPSVAIQYKNKYEYEKDRAGIARYADIRRA